MPLLCIAGRHVINPSNVRNQGFDFGSCGRCGRDMIRARSTWKTLPADFRIVWKAARRFGLAEQGNFIRNLPMVIPVKPTKAPARLRPRRRHFSFGELVPTGLTLLAWSGADGLKEWRKNFVTRRFEQRGVILLPAC